jgi:ubiquinone/menaquinone biosynthesis C-methylase UbiE
MTSAIKLADEKLHAREQWNEDPCGEVYGQGSEFGTREFFDTVEHHRYQEYAPWMPEIMGFDAFAGARLVEVGCGMGTDLLQFARGGANCVGLDITSRSVEISRQHFLVYGVDARFALSDAERLPFGDDALDVYYSNGVLHHTPETEAAVREAYRVLAPGGTAKVMLYHRNSWGYWFEMMFKQGIVRGEFFRGLSRADVLSRYVEYNDGGGRPLVKVYSRSEVRAMFSMFRDVRVEVEQLTRPEIYFVGGLIPEKLFRSMRRSIGWNIIVTAIK